MKAQFYDVSRALGKIGEARDALNKQSYKEAIRLAQEAISLASPPYWLYAGVGIVVVACLVVGAYLYRRRKKN